MNTSQVKLRSEKFDDNNNNNDDNNNNNNDDDNDYDNNNNNNVLSEYRSISLEKGNKQGVKFMKTWVRIHCLFPTCCPQ